MHVVKVSLDNELQNDLTANSEAQKLGHPEFIRRALHFYLRVSEQARVRRQYQKGYGNADLTELALEMQAWEDEHVWPET